MLNVWENGYMDNIKSRYAYGWSFEPSQHLHLFMLLLHSIIGGADCQSPRWGFSYPYPAFHVSTYLKVLYIFDIWRCTTHKHIHIQGGWAPTYIEYLVFCSLTPIFLHTHFPRFVQVINLYYNLHVSAWQKEFFIKKLLYFCCRLCIFFLSSSPSSFTFSLYSSGFSLRSMGSPTATTVAVPHFLHSATWKTYFTIAFGSTWMFQGAAKWKELSVCLLLDNRYAYFFLLSFFILVPCLGIDGLCDFNVRSNCRGKGRGREIVNEGGDWGEVVDELYRWRFSRGHVTS